MQYSACSKCKDPYRLHQLAHCCNISILMCATCQKRNRCLQCGNLFFDHKKCLPNCKCVLSSKKAIRLLTPLKTCATCKKSKNLCICKLVFDARPVSKSKIAPIERCDKCYGVTKQSELFYNVGCRHQLCGNCHSTKLEKCFCGVRIEENVAKVGESQCVVCEQRFRDEVSYSGTDDYFICKRCKEKSENLEKSYKDDKSSSTMNTSKPNSQQQTKEPAIESTHQQSPKPHLDLKQRPQTATQSTQQQLKQKNKKQILDKLFPPQNPSGRKQKSSNINSISNSRVTNKSLICSRCNIQFSFKLFDRSGCSSKLHKVCKICVINIRTNKENQCQQCVIQYEIYLNKKLIYEEIKEIDKAEHVERTMEGLKLCVKCCVVVEERHIYEGMCKICVTG